MGELALELREEDYRPDPILRVFILRANGELRPLGISTLRDRVAAQADHEINVLAWGTAAN